MFEGNTLSIKHELSFVTSNAGRYTKSSIMAGLLAPAPLNNLYTYPSRLNSSGMYINFQAVTAAATATVFHRFPY